jgi:hypothetical protein
MQKETFVKYVESPKTFNRIGVNWILLNLIVLFVITAERQSVVRPEEPVSRSSAAQSIHSSGGNSIHGNSEELGETFFRKARRKTIKEDIIRTRL